MKWAPEGLVGRRLDWLLKQKIDTEIPSLRISLF